MNFEHVTDENVVEEALGINLEESDGVDGQVQKKMSHDSVLGPFEGFFSI